MATDPLYRKITVTEFLAMDFGTDHKFELVDGVIQMTTGGTEPHAWIAGNIHFWLRSHLKGTGCRPYGSDMGVEVTPTDLRYPDVSVFCSPRPADFRDIRSLPDPVVVVEVLSSSTAQKDQGSKTAEYKGLPSVQVIGLVDPVNELVKTVARTEDGWLESFFARRDLDFGPLRLSMPYDDIFSLDLR